MLGMTTGLSGVRDRFGIFGTITRFRELSLLLVMMLRIPNIGLWLSDSEPESGSAA